MAPRPEEFRRTLPALSAAVPVTIIFVAVLSIVLTAAGSPGLRLSWAESRSWIVVSYGLPALPSVVFAVRYRQPMLLTGNVFAITFFASLGDQFSVAELSGASLLAGAIVLVAAAFGLARHIAAWIRAPIVQGLIAGAVMPFVASIFSGLSPDQARRVRCPVYVSGASDGGRVARPYRAQACATVPGRITMQPLTWMIPGMTPCR